MYLNVVCCYLWVLFFLKKKVQLQPFKLALCCILLPYYFVTLTEFFCEDFLFLTTWNFPFYDIQCIIFHKWKRLCPQWLQNCITILIYIGFITVFLENEVLNIISLEPQLLNLISNSPCIHIIIWKFAYHIWRLIRIFVIKLYHIHLLWLRQ